MNNIEKIIAQELLQINAIKLNPANPFTWASGWKSPIYCDNRKILSYPKIREIVKNAFADMLIEEFGMPDVIAGVATGAIAHGMLVADILDIPFVYVRDSSKKHGLTNIIEGVLEANQKVVVIEDLVSTGGSSLKAVETIREKGAEVLGMLAIFSYGFEMAENNFNKANCKLETLTNYQILIDIALETKYIKETDIETLKQWRKNPDTWMQ
ncbi:MAG: orotate phosphoribosyltransferase [Bacteroidales bacterium]|nr:orotate phosphoribosyltransferase [Bacteroidales bacterium]MBN2758368.1 orotate phosphoribosyltransferase [Bacteroidales bacterium]